MINSIRNRYCNFIAKNVRYGTRTKFNTNKSPSYTMCTWRASNASFKSFHSNSINSLLEAQYEKKYPGKTPFVIASQIVHFEHVDFFMILCQAAARADILILIRCTIVFEGAM